MGPRAQHSHRRVNGRLVHHSGSTCPAPLSPGKSHNGHKKELPGQDERPAGSFGTAGVVHTAELSSSSLRPAGRPPPRVQVTTRPGGHLATARTAPERPLPGAGFFLCVLTGTKREPSEGPPERTALPWPPFYKQEGHSRWWCVPKVTQL